MPASVRTPSVDYLQLSITPAGWSQDLAEPEQDVILSGLYFTALIVAREYQAAHAALSTRCKKIWTAEKLEDAYNGITRDMTEPLIDPDPITFMSEWQFMRIDQVGWVYVPITENCLVEAITTVIVRPKTGTHQLATFSRFSISTPKGDLTFLRKPEIANYKIDEIEFGRP